MWKNADLHRLDFSQSTIIELHPSDVFKIYEKFAELFGMITGIFGELEPQNPYV